VTPVARKVWLPTFGQSPVEALRKVVVHVADGRKLSQIERRQAGREVVRGKALETGTDQLRRAQGLGESDIDQNAEGEYDFSEEKLADSFGILPLKMEA
jgi:hypothetical protein